MWTQSDILNSIDHNVLDIGKINWGWFTKGAENTHSINWIFT